jgi:hypothetical protein
MHLYADREHCYGNSQSLLMRGCCPPQDGLFPLWSATGAINPPFYCVILANVIGSLFLNTFVIADALIGQPTCFTTMTICVQQNGVSQLWYLAGQGSSLFFCPCGRRYCAFIFALISLAGRVSSGTFPLIDFRLMSVESASSIVKV